MFRKGLRNNEDEVTRATCCRELLQRSRRKKQRATPHCVRFNRIVMHPLRYPCSAPTVCNSSNARVFYGRSLHLLKQLWHLCPLVRCNVPSHTPLPCGQFINFPSFDPIIFARLDHSTWLNDISILILASLVRPSFFPLSRHLPADGKRSRRANGMRWKCISHAYAPEY